MALFCAAVLAWTGTSAGTPGAHNRTLKLATWNLEWLIAPDAFKSLKDRCVPAGTSFRGGERTLPCDVAARLERSATDFAALAQYARQLDADVIALQEVDGPEAARLVFPGYEFCFTGRRQPQNNGFAIRANLPHRCGRDLRSLSLGDSLRRGAELVLFPDDPREIRLLNVHLKAGCSREPPTSTKDACRDLARQVPKLEAWIDEQAGAQRRFAVLGDFNRDLLLEQRGARAVTDPAFSMWQALDDGDPPEADLVNTADGRRFTNCFPGQGFSSYIDFIVLGRRLASSLAPGSFERVTYRVTDARRRKLSDHCPVAVRLRID